MQEQQLKAELKTIIAEIIEVDELAMTRTSCAIWVSTR